MVRSENRPRKSFTRHTGARGKNRQPGFRRRFALETLEERALLSTITIDTDTGTITGPFPSGTVYGVPYTADLVSGVEEFLIDGDLNFMSGDVVNGVGSHPADLIVGNDVNLNGATINFSAVSIVPGPGGGEGGSGGDSGAGGPGATGPAGAIGGAGGSRRSGVERHRVPRRQWVEWRRRRACWHGLPWLRRRRRYSGRRMVSVRREALARGGPVAVVAVAGARAIQARAASADREEVPGQSTIMVDGGQRRRLAAMAATETAVIKPNEGNNGVWWDQHG